MLLTNNGPNTSVRGSVITPANSLWLLPPTPYNHLILLRSEFQSQKQKKRRTGKHEQGGEGRLKVEFAERESDVKWKMGNALSSIGLFETDFQRC